VLGQHRGELGPEVRGVVQILDVGAVDTENVIHPERREVSDDVIDHPVLAEHVLTLS
jgi:hypothetical protein